jgi:hypothetical protein
MRLLLCSRTLGPSDGLSASNNVQLYSCSPLIPLLSFTLTFFDNFSESLFFSLLACFFYSHPHMGNSARSALAEKGAKARFALLCQCSLPTSTSTII